MQLITLKKQMQKLLTNYKKGKTAILKNKLQQAALYSKELKLEKLQNKNRRLLYKKQDEIKAIERELQNRVSNH